MAIGKALLVIDRVKLEIIQAEILLTLGVDAQADRISVGDHAEGDVSATLV